MRKNPVNTRIIIKCVCAENNKRKPGKRLQKLRISVRQNDAYNSWN